jgi:tetratricopeptide (TPR) repeat protein
MCQAEKQLETAAPGKRPRCRRLLAISLLLGLIAAGVALAVPHVRAWRELRAARADVAQYHTPQAIRHLQAYLRVWPNDADALLLAARAARRAGAYDEAEHCLEKYQQIRGSDEAGGFEQLLLSAECGVESANDLCRQYLEQEHPDSSLIYEALARAYMRQFRLPEARACLERWLKSQPENAQVFCLKGRFHLDYEHARAVAVESYRQAVKLDPEHEEARLGLAVALLESRLYMEAAEHFAWLLNRQPSNLRVRIGLADCRHVLGDHDEAVRLVDHVLAERPNYAPALSLRGRLLLQDGQFAEAESCLRQALALTPQDHQARFNLIKCLSNNGKDSEAQEQQRLLTQWEEDLKHFNEIIQRDMVRRPNDPALHCTLGELLLRNGYREEGLHWLNSALRQDPQYAPARQALAKYRPSLAGR